MIPLPILVGEGYVDDISDALTNLQLLGGLLIGVGLYAFVDKWQVTGLMKVETVYDVILNISLVMVIAGGVIFIVSFAGCVGALRENTCLLKFVSVVIYNSVLCNYNIVVSCYSIIYLLWHPHLCTSLVWRELKVSAVNSDDKVLLY